ncbi:MAG: tetratricopeptide repeat protein [Candidatus Acidiferrum sp.]
MAAFQKELEVVPENAQAILYFGDVAMKNGDYQKALALLVQSSRLQSDNRLAYLDMARIFVDQKQYEQAQTALLQAIQLDPSEPDAHFRLGHVYQQMGDTADAEKEFAKVRELKQKKDPEAGKTPKAQTANPQN